MAKVLNLEKLNRKLAAMAPAAKTAIKAALDKSADELVRAQQALVRIDEGDLQRSIRKGAGTHELSVQVLAGGPATTKPVRNGADASYDYALAVEHGTQDMNARPFFWPAYRSGRKRYSARAKREATKAAKKAAGVT